MLRKVKSLASSTKYILYEQSPTRRTIVIDGEIHTISFPYIIFVINENLLYVYALDKPFRSFELDKDNLRILPLPNIDYNGFVCLGKFSSKIPKEIINRFWTSEFSTTTYAGYWFTHGIYINSDTIENLLPVLYELPC